MVSLEKVEVKIKPLDAVLRFELEENPAGQAERAVLDHEPMEVVCKEQENILPPMRKPL